jgi:adenosine kinase
MAHAAELSFRTVQGCDLTIISPNDPAAMVQYAEECRTLGVPYIFDPSQQVARLSGEELKDGLVGSTILICNDYELEIIKQKTGFDEDQVRARTSALVVTRGEKGSAVFHGSERIEVQAVPPSRVVDPTGVGDAFRGGFMKGMAAGADYRTCARLGSVAATYALEHLGGQSHAYTWQEFKTRYEAHFGSLSL